MLRLFVKKIDLNSKNKSVSIYGIYYSVKEIYYSVKGIYYSVKKMKVPI
ncbi:hypothetical protein SAMN02910414_02226 [Lachnobacterium bovis DSM 14045]|uniref:Uncharacterized protein n=1 Tax=Lachnobacterium bovis DSM 14045 TaxID=1122142 RepID=A0A1H3M7H3_9FIRM|nr:hypothetical protein SAMN02910414_02226 [Lachnobacterium bovis DSM 14045]